LPEVEISPVNLSSMDLNTLLIAFFREFLKKHLSLLRVFAALPYGHFHLSKGAMGNKNSSVFFKLH
jgi:hypothetical protein